MKEHIFLHREANPTPIVDRPWAGTVAEGEPHTLTNNGYSSADGTLHMGVWESSVGVWKVDYKVWEYCNFLEGHCILTPENGEPIHLKAGDVFIIEPGFKGRWEVVEKVKKYYVIKL
ncbi:cupin domain-containing protein [Leeia sp. TBRC 13508]|uniref:Cupin domain-containing protein n=1 Tax=Leeia speluncae TaxID=2884804 RepID=A0ABS8D8V8_9NEIS|nr:cupin domain-containing protein [Leeia speluncae]MCB6184615.1 cupin domain-containing protein [Leeia speluncae]